MRLRSIKNGLQEGPVLPLHRPSIRPTRYLLVVRRWFARWLQIKSSAASRGALAERLSTLGCLAADAKAWTRLAAAGLYQPQSSSASRFTAGAFGFLTLSQFGERGAFSFRAVSVGLIYKPDLRRTLYSRLSHHFFQPRAKDAKPCFCRPSITISLGHFRWGGIVRTA